MDALIPTLQTAIGPVILISGVGLLLLTMTNRLGRAIDRARNLAARVPHADQVERGLLSAQLRVLWRRARLIRTAIVLASVSALSAAVLVIVIFAASLSDISLFGLIVALFVVCLACLVLSLAVFIHDVNQSLAALSLELHSRTLNGADGDP
jgi:hypothetical protein